jgi:subtilisin-like proprotein convertase family protein
MKIIATYLLVLLFGFGLSAQTFTFVDESEIQLEVNAEVNLPLAEYATLTAEVSDLRQALVYAPLEVNTSLTRSATQIQLPLPDGTMRTFRVVESPVMPEALQARWPQLRTYRVQDVSAPQYKGRLTVTPQGITATYTSYDGEVFVEPYASNQSFVHVVYFNHDLVLTPEELPQLACGYEPSETEDPKTINTDGEVVSEINRTTASTTANIYEYVMALTCTGEYAAQKGGTVEAVLSSFVTAINLANATFENEVGVRIRLIENQELLVYLNAGTDPFINADEGGELLSQVQGAITSAGFPTSSYDMGHVFTSSCTDVGGVVGGQVCTAGKDRGVTCHYSNNIASIIRRVFTHEVAHQFATAHSWSNCPNSLGQLASGSAFEPGSGTTIMSYAGSCGNQNVAFDNDDYYHGHSIEQFTEYTRQGNAAACATVIPTDNTEPKITLNYTDGFYIPISTPFELDAAVVDAEEDPVTYCWEQMNLGPLSDLGAPFGNAPIFRSYPPTTASNRVLPRLVDLLSNNSTITEILPTYSRDIAFRCTVRDNSPEIGATVWADVAFKSTATAGPFLVMSPNNSSTVWQAGEYREVTWDVANTTNELVNCQLVNIRLSSDGGQTYPYTLVSGVPNSGTAFVTVPEVTGSNMRVRVEAANNIFFDISNANFSIEPATVPTYTLNYGPVFQQLCLPDVTTVDFTTGAVLDYTTPINLSISSELPEGVNAVFSNNDFAPGEGVSLQLDFSNLEDYDGPLEIEVAVATTDLDTSYRTIYLELVDNDFSDLSLLTPVEGEPNITLGTTYTWTPLDNAQLYDWELSDDAGFSNVLDSRYGISETEVIQLTQLENNDLFFWRVRAINECGTGEWQAPQVFHTVNVLCTQQLAEDTPVNIPGTGLPPTVTSQVFVPFNGVISDVNIPFLRVRYQPIQNFYISLISPAGTEVRLYDGDCFGSDVVAIGFDDEAPNEIICPPDDQILFKPIEALSAFDGENSEGIWTLKVKILETGFGSSGQISEWGLEFCAAGNSAAPALLSNDTLFVPPLMSNPVTNDLLQVTDTEQGPFDLTYSLVSTPGHGTLYLVDQELSPGSTFTQGTIDASNLRYQNTNPDAINDGFTFVVEDGTGGFLPVQRFDIKIDENAVVGTEEISAGNHFLLYPNPTSEMVNLLLPTSNTEDMRLRVFNISGQLLLEEKVAAGTLQHQLTTTAWPNGIYLVQLGGRTLKLVKQ